MDLEEESDGIEELSPELAQLLAKAKKETNNKSTQKKEKETESHGGPSNSVRVDLRIRILPHPEDETGRVEIINHTMKRVSTNSYRKGSLGLPCHLLIPS